MQPQPGHRREYAAAWRGWRGRTRGTATDQAPKYIAGATSDPLAAICIDHRRFLLDDCHVFRNYGWSDHLLNIDNLGNLDLLRHRRRRWRWGCRGYKKRIQHPFR